MEEAEWLRDELNSSVVNEAFSPGFGSSSSAMNVTTNTSGLNLTQPEDGINIYYFYEVNQYFSHLFIINKDRKSLN